MIPVGKQLRNLVREGLRFFLALAPFCRLGFFQPSFVLFLVEVADALSLLLGPAGGEAVPGRGGFCPMALAASFRIAPAAPTPMIVPMVLRLLA